MSSSLVVPSRSRVISSASMADRRKPSPFDKYDVREEVRERVHKDAKEDRVLSELLDMWKSNWRTEISFGMGYVFDYDYEELRDIFKSRKDSLNYSARDVQKFIIMLADFQKEESFCVKLGHIITALIEFGKDDISSLYLGHLDFTPSINIFGLNKNVAIKGDLVSFISCLESGEIIVNGNIDYLSCPDDDSTVKITVNGHVEHISGVGSEKVTIFVNGELGKIVDSSCQVYQNGMLVWANRKPASLEDDSHR